jgi:hypothetical protein
MTQKMQSPDVFQCIREGHGRFFNLLEEHMWRVEAEPLWPWLNLLTTDAIEKWAKESRSVSKVGSRRRHGEEVLRLLLTRHLLDLGTRRDPSPLQQFWRWAVRSDSFSFMHRWWENLPSTLDDGAATIERITGEERRLTSLLEAASGELRRRVGPAWAAEAMQSLLDRRRAPINPAARVVFAWHAAPLDCRAGILAEFRLLARCGAEIKLSNRESFDDSFLAALENDVAARLDTGTLRHLEHDWAFFPSKTLTDISGTMAFWVAFAFASPGRRFPGSVWAVPPWVVISAAIDRSACHALGGSAASVSGIDAKLSVLAEEGVRVVAISKTNALLTSPHPDIALLHVRGNGYDVAKALLDANLTLPAADWSSLDSMLFEDGADVQPSRVHERGQAHQSSLKPQSDYITPTYGSQEITWQVAERLVPPASRVSIPIDSGVTSLAFGEILAVGCEDGTVRYWDPLVSRVVLRKLEPSHLKQVNCVAISPDGRWLASCGRGKNEAINVWELSATHSAPQEPIHSRRLAAHSKTVRRLAFSHNGAKLASCAADGVRIWDLLDGTSFTLDSIPIVTEKDPWLCVAISDDGLRLALASKAGRIVVVRISSGKVEQELKADSGPTMAICYHPNGAVLASTGADRVIKLWGTNGRIIFQDAILEEASKDLAFSADGALLLSGGKGKRTARKPKSAVKGAEHSQKVLLWAWNGTRLTLLDERKVNATVRCVTFSPVRELGAYATGANGMTGASIYLWNAGCRTPTSS